MEQVDELELKLQAYMNSFCQIVEGIIEPTQPIDLTAKANELQHYKKQMIGLVNEMTFVDKPPEQLYREMKAYEEINKNSIRRVQHVDRQLEIIKNTIQQSIDELQRGEVMEEESLGKD
jgi:hypothetical protein